MALFKKAYLLIYNSIQIIGWSYILFKTLKFLLVNQTVLGLWDECGTSVAIFQSLAALEVLHCIVGFVPSRAIVTFVQVFSRVAMIWLIIVPVERAQNCPTLPLTLIAWSLAEIVRYSYYCAHLLSTPLKLLTWFRYSLFMVLYPAGLLGELGNILYSLDTLKRTEMFSIILPNPYNISFSYYYFILFLTTFYVPLFPHHFIYMLRQRKKVYSTPSEEAIKKVK